MTVTRIATTDEATSLNDLCGTWKIVAHAFPNGWRWNLSAADEATFRALAMRENRNEQPHYSVVTGRLETGECVLYARVFPVAWRRDPGRDAWDGRHRRWA
jgi:hypothetical protein